MVRVTADTTGVAPRADAKAVEALEAYCAARQRGEYQLLKLAGADLRDVDFSGCQLDECDLSEALLDGAKFLGASLVRSSLAGASLLGADFSYADLHRADLEAVDATAATFVNAILTRADFARSRLQRVNLTESDLTRANLFKSDLSGANLSRALASQTNLRGVILDDAVLAGLRGEPIFDLDHTSDHTRRAVAPFGWPAALLTEQHLAEFAESYLTSLGWEILQPASSEDPVVDLMARRDDTWFILEVKATTNLSHSTFAHVAERLRRAAEPFGKALLALVVPGPISKDLRDLARTSRVDILSVRVDSDAVWIDSESKHVRAKAPRSVTIKVVCDFPHEREVQATETVRFGYEGQEYEIDLCPMHAGQMRAILNPYIEKARRVSGGGRRRGTRAIAKRRSHSDETQESGVLQGLRATQRRTASAAIADEYKAVKG
jgi:uncharacterized protein YjbI with pentapeptide repeats/Holliday junction resolvase